MIDPLKDIIRAHIKSQGPISIASYMEFCLLHPKYGYYTTQESIGKAGDFTTAPEISQCFGEMIGIWTLDLIHQLQNQNEGKSISIVELGPGRGTLMKDVLNTLSRFVDASQIDITLVEASPKLKAIQEKTLVDFEFEVSWAKNLDQLRSKPTIFIANEFFDALPIHQYQFVDGHWSERLIGLTDKNELQIGLGSIVKAMDPVTALKKAQGVLLEQDAIIEDSPISIGYVDRILDHIEKQSGAALIIDYGYINSDIGDTFQAMKNHQFCDPLESPGKADLTAHVNFASLSSQVMGREIAVYPTLTQSDFLMAHGIAQRAEQLASKNPKQSSDIQIAINRLCDADKMGSLFKAMQFTSKNILPQIFGNPE